MSLQLAAALYIYMLVHYALNKKEKRVDGGGKGNCTYTSREVYSGSSLLADLNLQLVSGLYKNFTRMSPSEFEFLINPLNPELNPICYLLALLGAHHFLHVSNIRVKSLTFRRLMSYIYGRSHAEIVGSNPTGGMDICLL